MYRLRIVLVFIVVALSSSIALAADQNIYVRSGAGGNDDGSDWTNAYDTIAEGETAVDRSTYDDVYIWVAGGSYSESLTVDASTDGTDTIYIIRATESSHGTETGWNDTYDDSAITITGQQTISTDYIHFDGVAGGGPGDWDGTYGIKFTDTDDKRIILSANSDHITFDHCEITNSSQSTDGTYGSLIYAYGNVTYVTIQYCKVHYVYGCCIQTGYGGIDNWTIEYTKIGDNTGDANHSEIWSALGNDDWTWRYNYIFRWRSSGALIAVNGTEESYGDAEICENWLIYGNIFNSVSATTSSVIRVYNDASNQQFLRSARVYNNSFINLEAASTTWVSFGIATYETADNQLKNNIFFTNNGDGIDLGTGQWTDDYNSYKSGINTNGQDGANDEFISDPFTDYDNDDFSLAASTTAGDDSIGATYNTDMTGKTRGDDGTWDRGAYEYAPVEGSSNTKSSMTGASGGSPVTSASGGMAIQ